MRYYYFRKLIEELTERARVEEGVLPHLFGLSCLTALAKVLTESKSELYAVQVRFTDQEHCDLP